MTECICVCRNRSQNVFCHSFILFCCSHRGVLGLDSTATSDVKSVWLSDNVNIDWILNVPNRKSVILRANTNKNIRQQQHRKLKLRGFYTRHIAALVYKHLSRPLCVLDFGVSQVKGETVSAAQLINRSVGSIYLHLTQSCWEMGMLKWESTVRFVSPQLPSGHFTQPPPLPTNPSLQGEEKVIDIKQAESSLPLPSAIHRNWWGHFNVFCPQLTELPLSLQSVAMIPLYCNYIQGHHVWSSIKFPLKVCIFHLPNQASFALMLMAGVPCT